MIEEQKDDSGSVSLTFGKQAVAGSAVDYRSVKVMIGLSGGINSMAVLVWLAQYELRPKELHLFYAHFEEHSPGTLEFVLAGVWVSVGVDVFDEPLNFVAAKNPPIPKTKRAPIAKRSLLFT